MGTVLSAMCTTEEKIVDDDDDDDTDNNSDYDGYTKTNSTAEHLPSKETPRTPFITPNIEDIVADIKCSSREHACTFCQKNYPRYVLQPCSCKCICSACLLEIAYDKIELLNTCPVCGRTPITQIAIY